MQTVVVRVLVLSFISIIVSVYWLVLVLIFIIMIVGVYWLDSDVLPVDYMRM